MNVNRLQYRGRFGASDTCCVYVDDDMIGGIRRGDRMQNPVVDYSGNEFVEGFSSRWRLRSAFPHLVAAV